MSSTPIAIEHSTSMKSHRDVESGLSAERRKQGIGSLPGDDLLDELGSDRFDVGGVGELGIGHDRGRVANSPGSPGSPQRRRTLAA